MRPVSLCLSALVLACSSADVTNVAPVPPPDPITVASIVIDMPSSLVVGDSAPVRVTLLDANGNALTRPLTFISSDPLVAAINGSGVITALGEGHASISVSSEGKTVQGGLSVSPPPVTEVCREGPDVCVSAYDLVAVNGQALPVKSPWGVGEWDYDDDAGTWVLASATLTLLRDGGFTFTTAHIAASGAVTHEGTSGSYARSGNSIQMTGVTGTTRSAKIEGNVLTVDWETGLTFTFNDRR
jgi:hypothetical protein